MEAQALPRSDGDSSPSYMGSRDSLNNWIGCIIFTQRNPAHCVWHPPIFVMGGPQILFWGDMAACPASGTPTDFRVQLVGSKSFPRILVNVAHWVRWR